MAEIEKCCQSCRELIIHGDYRNMCQIDWRFIQEPFKQCCDRWSAESLIPLKERNE